MTLKDEDGLSFLWVLMSNNLMLKISNFRTRYRPKTQNEDPRHNQIAQNQPSSSETAAIFPSSPSPTLQLATIGFLVSRGAPNLFQPPSLPPIPFNFFFHLVSLIPLRILCIFKRFLSQNSYQFLAQEHSMGFRDFLLWHCPLIFKRGGIADKGACFSPKRSRGTPAV
ncbi:hypothetical protein CEXT_699841 [Caerostris extrusa]|uniref:Uncharacterized protein n=1 Tax=Caerostris extrusa TaxID=172846 RepID=A0AAV4W220_CAEEX|nr:hypothetical protein CEXT_699841 [Caerostris extrusa]